MRCGAYIYSGKKIFLFFSVGKKVWGNIIPLSSLRVQ